MDVASLIIFQIPYEHHNNISWNDENSIKFRCFSTLMVRLNDTALDSNRFWNDSIGIIPAVTYISLVFDRLYIAPILFSFQRSWNFKFKSWKPEILSLVFDECVPNILSNIYDVMLIPIWKLWPVINRSRSYSFWRFLIIISFISNIFYYR